MTSAAGLAGSSRREREIGAAGVVVHVGAHAVDGLEDLGRERLFGRAPGSHAALRQDQQPVEIGERQVQVVQDADHGEAVGVQLFEQLEQAQLMRHIEARCRFVEEQDAGVLHERLGQHDHLLLAARELGEAALGKLGYAELAERRRGHAGRRALGAAAVGAHLDHLAHGKVELEREVLRHQGDLASHVAALVLAGRAAVDEDRAGTRREQAVDQVEQRALAAAVGSDHPHEVAGFHVERQALEHGVVGIVGKRRLAHRDDRRGAFGGRMRGVRAGGYGRTAGVRAAGRCRTRGVRAARRAAARDVRGVEPAHARLPRRSR